MKPKFKNTIDWEQAQMLMQPIFIRVIDNIRKQLDNSSWKGVYQQIDEPYPRYELLLSRNEKVIELDIWQLCYQICFINFTTKVIELQQHLAQQNGTQIEEIQEVEIDTSLIDNDGQVDWIKIEEKTNYVITNVFNNLV
jgi:hypothetical protein